LDEKGYAFFVISGSWSKPECVCGVIEFRPEWDHYRSDQWRTYFGFDGRKARIIIASDCEYSREFCLDVAILIAAGKFNRRIRHVDLNEGSHLGKQKQGALPAGQRMAKSKKERSHYERRLL
jgi:hypothetical protein